MVASYLSGRMRFNDFSNVVHLALAEDPEDQAILRLVHLIADYQAGAITLEGFREWLGVEVQNASS